MFPIHPPHHPELEDVFKIICDRVRELFSKSLTTVGSEGFDEKLDHLRISVKGYEATILWIYEEESIQMA